MRVEFLSTIAVITPDPPASTRLDVETLGLPLEGEAYRHSTSPGCKSFGIWPLPQAAQACFGTAQWPTVPTGATGQHRIRRRRPRCRRAGCTRLEQGWPAAA